MLAVHPSTVRVFLHVLAASVWSAFGVLVAAGVWNLTVTGVGEPGSAYRATIEAKLGVVALSGLAAALHARARSPRGLAAWGAISGIAALFLGLLLHG